MKYLSVCTCEPQARGSRPFASNAGAAGGDSYLHWASIANWDARTAIRGGRGWREPAVSDAGLGGACNGARESSRLGSPSAAGPGSKKGSRVPNLPLPTFVYSVLY